MGRGLGPTQRAVLDFLEQRWSEPADPVLGPMVPQAAVAAALASGHSEAQAIRRAIRTLKDRNLIGTACLQTAHDLWLVPASNGQDEPRPRSQRKLANLRAAIFHLLTPDWQQVQEIRLQVIGERPGREQKWAGSHEWDRERQRFNRALSQLCHEGLAETVGMTHGYLQKGWLVRSVT